MIIYFVFFRGRVDDLSFFEYLSPFCFLSIEFHCTFSISYKILPYFIHYYCIIIVFWPRWFGGLEFSQRLPLCVS